MLKIIFAIFIFVISSLIIQPQTVSLGTGMGPDILIFDDGVATGLNLNLSLNVQLNRIFELEFKPGIAFNSGDFNGFELSSNLKILPFAIPINLIVGIKLHTNEGGGGNSVKIRDDLFKLPTIGVGYKTKVQKTYLTFDIIYQKPFPSGVHWSILANEYYYSTDFNAVISFNIGFAWQL